MQIAKISMKRRQKAQGFTLIEVVVATTILMSALGLAVTLVGNGTLQIIGSRNRVAGVYALQNCMELTRNVRDTATKHLNRWHCPFFADVLAGSSVLYLEIEGNDGENSGIGNCQEQYGATITQTDANGGIITELNGVEFKTLLKIDEIQTEERQSLSGIPQQVATQLRATCQVRWTQRTGDEMVEASQILTDWYKP